MKKPTTIKDIAEKLQVSIATVSRALRNSPEIKKETKEVVLAMAKSMDYHPNLLASGLSSKRSRILGVVVPTINRYFWANSIAGIENIAYKEGYKVMIFQSGESYQKEVEIVETLANSKADGIIIAFSKETCAFQHVAHVLERAVPVVLYERACGNIDTSKVVTDDQNGMFQLTSHLIEKGRKNIAYIGGPLSLGVCKDRLSGYLQALKAAGMKSKDGNIVSLEDFTIGLAEKAFRNLWNEKEKPDGIICFADILAIGVLHAAQQLGIRVPKQVSIAGFGNDETGRYLRPALTTMSQPSFEMGKMAANILLKEIDFQGEPHLRRMEVIRPTLLVREST
ncbi:LacI family DNA-binding transcriptional regulator [Cyclobacterium jeungdonense]|uniref:LacI family DNA-binding transcriptional regulator n=1 Tax=Cyclobacterium jeungdonense TaxID=708087 RepID=A0ABT8C0P7_9BACT|nr:LacI family DNA-binding transcriptional regulator [Cyclobacterium jeungdonense]MDN3686365.1 LacI family DNA-binding transcriptional regulator [Cyclobacterium jeungdonense]